MTYLATVSSKNQFTLPIGLVNKFNLLKGSKIIINLIDDQTATISPVQDLTLLRKKLSKNPIAKKYAKLSWNQLVKTPEWHQAEYENAKRIANVK